MTEKDWFDVDKKKVERNVIKKEHRFLIKTLKKLHERVHPDPDIVQSARAKWPEILDDAVWVPWLVQFKMHVHSIFFLCVDIDESKADNDERIRLVVVDYNEPALEFASEAWQKKPVLHLAGLVHLPADLLGCINETHRMFFDYSRHVKIKKEIYAQELRRKTSQAQTLGQKLKGGDS